LEWMVNDGAFPFVEPSFDLKSKISCATTRRRGYTTIIWVC
jgi:hypothetical protein